MLFIEIIACLGSAIGERCIGKSGQRREPLMRQKYKLVESVIMNNASCAPITHTHTLSQKSALHRYYIGKGGGDCGSRRRGGRVTAGSLHAVNFLWMVAAYVPIT